MSQEIVRLSVGLTRMDGWKPWAIAARTSAFVYHIQIAVFFKPAGLK